MRPNVCGGIHPVMRYAELDGGYCYFIHKMDVFCMISDLSQAKVGCLAGGWQTTQTVLSELVPASEVFPRPQDAVL